MFARRACTVTARQYGEVVLPDASIRAESRYPAAGGATKLSRCKEGMAWFLPSGYKLSELYECRGTKLIGSRLQVKVHRILLRAPARSRYKLLQICQGSRSNSKNHDKQLTHIVRVMGSCYLFVNKLFSVYDSDWIFSFLIVFVGCLGD